MPINNNKNVLVGAAYLYFSTKDSLDPDFYVSPTSDVPATQIPTIPSGQVATQVLDASPDWRYAGLTQEGVEMSYEPDYGEVEVDQYLDAAVMFKQKMTVSVKTTLVEATFKNLMVAWAQSPNSGEGLAPTYKAKGVDGYNDSTGFDGRNLNTGDEHLGLDAGSVGVSPVERSLAFVSRSEPSIDGKKRERVYYARRALEVDSTMHGLKRSDPTVFPVSFRLLPASVSGASYGTILNRVITSS